MSDRPQPTGPADEAALTWFVLLRDEPVSAADRAGHAAWLAADPRHRTAWQDVNRLWASLDQARPAALPAARAQVRRFPMRRRVAALAAGVLLAFVGLWQAAPQGLFADERSGIGERRTLTLADGSSVELGTGSALSVRFGPQERRVVLHRGEGFFTVKPDAAKPFVVEAEDGRVTVVGTRFDIKIDEAVSDGRSVAVAVVEGIVDVAASPGVPPARLTAGQAVRYGNGGATAPGPFDPAAATAWRHDRLVFQTVPLGQVVRDLERYRWGRIVVMDDALAAMPVTGMFSTQRTDAALETIANSLSVRLIRVTDLLAVLTLPPEKKSPTP